MGHTTGILFDLTFKPDTPETILDVFRHLVFCPEYRSNYNYISESQRAFNQLLMRCPETVVGPLFHPETKLNEKLLIFTTCLNHNINGWNGRDFNEETRRFRSAGDCKLQEYGDIVDILNVFTPYLVLKDTGTICARSLYEHDSQETVYWFDHIGFCASKGYRYDSRDKNYPNREKRPDRWILDGPFQPPMDFLVLQRAGLN